MCSADSSIFIVVVEITSMKEHSSLWKRNKAEFNRKIICISFHTHTHKKTYPSISCCVCSFIYLYATNVFVYIKCYFETDSFTWTCQSMCILNHRKHDDNDDHDQAQSMNFAYFLFLLGYRRRKKMNNIEGYK